MLYVDVKVTAWERLYFDDKASVDEVIKEAKSGIDYLFDSDKFLSSELLYDSIEYINIEENDNQSTIEIFNNNSSVWNNESIEEIREKKIKKIIE